jgi:ribosomal protein S18 acetylase RimI-like enzyme
MLAFVTAEEASLDAFLSVSDVSPYRTQLREYAESLLRQRCTRLSWCVVGLDADLPVARAALWSPPGGDVPTDIVLIDADWDEPDLAAGHALLAHVSELAVALGARGLAHHVDSPPVPPQYQENNAARARLLTEAGYRLERDGLRWLYTTSPEPKPAAGTSLTFRTLPEVGDNAFVEAMASTYEGTRDSILTRHIQESGLLEAAGSDFRDYQEMDHTPDWWELAYEQGELAGVVMPARNPSSAVVAYVGVAPRRRGRGLAAQLVRRATERLVASGATEIRGDCDRDNVAMAKAFRRAGYEQIARRRSYERALSA